MNINLIQTITVNSYNYFINGGIIVIPLFILSIILCYLIIERIFFYKNEPANIIEIFQNIENNMNMNNKIYKSKIYFCLSNIMNNKSKYKIFIKKTLNYFKNNISIIKVLSLTAPLLGLLGTVHGILNTFKFLNVSKFNDFSMLSKGISEALITTELGLIIAIPGYFFTVFLEKKFHRFEYEFEVLEDIIISRKEND